MADFSKFRTAVSGFNRTDVVNYIESTSIEHQKALRKLTDERDKLAAENARLQVELAGLQKRLEQAQADNDALSGQVNALAQEGSDLAEQLKKSEEARQELLIRPAPQPEEPAEPAPQPEEPETENEPDEPVQEPSLTEKELTAYRRAEQTERNAAVRARRIYAQLSNLCEDARTRYMDSGEEIAALAADLSTGLSRLQDAFAEVQVIFDDAQNAFVSAYRKSTKDGKFTVKVEYISCGSLEGKTLLLVDPMLATGSSLVLTYNALCEKGGTPAHTHVAAVVASEQGLDYAMKNMPRQTTTIWTAVVDEELTSRSYIVPGIGDAGDLAYGEKI